jgi:hypothetical protein
MNCFRGQVRNVPACRLGCGYQDPVILKDAQRLKTSVPPAKLKREVPAAMPTVLKGSSSCGLGASASRRIQHDFRSWRLIVVTLGR